jgi:transcriptional regulator GlxA family with amidase domain
LLQPDLIQHLLLRRRPFAVPSPAARAYACSMTPPSRIPPPVRSAAAIQRVQRHINDNLNRALALSELADLAGLSIWRFATVFRQQVGVSPHRYICRLRLARAQALIRQGVPVASAATEAGFYDQSHLSRHFKTVFGITPGQYLSAAGQPQTACQAFP